MSDKSLAFLGEITERLDEDIQVEVCYMDFSKGFDAFKHSHLDYTMTALEITGKDNTLVNNFLWERTVAVRIGGYVTVPAEMLSGVSKGPHYSSCSSTN